VGETIALRRRHGLTRAVFDDVVWSVPYFRCVGETVAVLKGAGVEIAVVSGGLKAMADRLSVDHKIHHCFAAAEYFWTEDGTILHWNVMPTYQLRLARPGADGEEEPDDPTRRGCGGRVDGDHWKGVRVGRTWGAGDYPCPPQ